MNDDQFDARMKGAFASDTGAPSERVWRLIGGRRRGWLPAPKEMLIAWAASAAVLLSLWAVAPGPDVGPVEIAAAEDTTYTVAAVTQVAGVVR